MYGYLRDAYDDVGVFSVDVYTFSRLMRQMAYEGAWQPVLDFLREALAEQTGIRDYIDGEKVVHGFVAAHLSMGGSVSAPFGIRTKQGVRRSLPRAIRRPILRHAVRLRTRTQGT